VSHFSKVHHMCVVVADIERAVAYYQSLGIGPWQDYPPLTNYTALDVPDREGFLGLTYKYCPIGDFQLQLVQPGEQPSPQREFLMTRGEGVFHIGFEVPDVDRAEQGLREQGVEVLMRGRRDDSSGFDYLDTADQAGVVLLVRQTPSG